MPEIMADSPDPTCYHLYSGTGIERNQILDPDPFVPRAREAWGRFATGCSGNPRGRPRGIPNRKRRVIGLRAWRANPRAALAVAKRKPWLLRPLLLQVLLLPLAALDPADRLGIDLSRLRTPQQAQRAIHRVRAALSRGDI